MTVQTPVYMDNHATTRCDPRVVQAMLPYFTEVYGNPGSVNHSFGSEAAAAVEAAREEIAQRIGATPRELVFTSGATESNNLAIRGVAERARRRGNHLVSVTTEHRAVLDPLERLGQAGYEVTLLSPHQQPASDAGVLDLDQLAESLREDTVLVSVMLANNEIGVLQPLAEIARLCRARGIPLHCDATQAVGKLPINVAELGVDLMSFAAHKFYGPKGVGALYVRRRGARLRPLIEGGGQEAGLRSGTLNTPGIIGMATALRLCDEVQPAEAQRLRELRDRLFQGLQQELSDVSLNGPALDQPELRLAGNLNVSFAYVDGEALMLSMRELAVSSGSACTSTNPEPSHVLRALGVSEDLTRASLRFGLGRFNTAEEVEFAIAQVAESVRRLRKLSSMA